MELLKMALVPLLGAVGLALAAGWIRDVRRWRRRERQYAERLRALRQAGAALEQRLQVGMRRRQELEELVQRLSERLQVHGPTPEERKLLNDIYYEYGTETHSLYFSSSPASAHSAEVS